MPVIAHLSDLHFGRHDPTVVAALERRLQSLRPDLIAISGDFTQRARRAQYKLAGAFVDRLEDAGFPVLAVPGNHDIPLYDVVRRFIWPLTRYKRFIASDVCPFYHKKGLAVLGINTARSLTVKHGFISPEQMERIRETFAKIGEGDVRVLVTHHPLFEVPLAEGHGAARAVSDHQTVLGAVADAGVQLLLAGHFHMSSAHSARDMVERAGPALVVQAGTAASTRLRADEAQSFNRIDCDGTHMSLTVETYRDGGFRPGDTVRYVCTGGHWRTI